MFLQFSNFFVFVFKHNEIFKVKTESQTDRKTERQKRDSFRGA